MRPELLISSEQLAAEQVDSTLSHRDSWSRVRQIAVAWRTQLHRRPGGRFPVLEEGVLVTGRHRQSPTEIMISWNTPLVDHVCFMGPPALPICADLSARRPEGLGVDSRCGASDWARCDQRLKNSMPARWRSLEARVSRQCAELAHCRCAKVDGNAACR